MAEDRPITSAKISSLHSHRNLANSITTGTEPLKGLEPKLPEILNTPGLAIVQILKAMDSKVKVT